jgi:hypothetical protein
LLALLVLNHQSPVAIARCDPFLIGRMWRRGEGKLVSFFSISHFCLDYGEISEMASLRSGELSAMTSRGECITTIIAPVRL